jgi:SAM-dependent methyltransferase
MDDARSKVRRMAQDALAAGDPVGWFDKFYRTAEGDADQVPWADLTVNPNLAEWLAANAPSGAGKSALVVGCGLGDDAEELARLGFRTTGFDISPTAVNWCQTRFPDSAVNYLTADLMNLPEAWAGRFDFIFESYTLQVLPGALRQSAMSAIAGCVSENGRLLIVTRARDDAEELEQLPWPMSPCELAFLETRELQQVSFEDYIEHVDPPVRRFRVEYRRP